MDERNMNDEALGVGRTYGPWVLFGVFGIGVAVGIALLAGSFASQPVGLSGSPVSAGSALKPAIGKEGLRNRPSRKVGRREKADRVIATPSTTGSSTAGSMTIAPSGGSESTSSSAGGSAESGGSLGSGGSSDPRSSSGTDSSSGDGPSSGGGESGESEGSGGSSYEDDSRDEAENEEDD